MKSYAADSIDVWILEQFPPDYLGYAVEVGAWDGISTSNTLALENIDWTVLCVEPQDALQERLRIARKLVEHGACGHYHRDVATLYINIVSPSGYTSLYPSERPEATLGWKEQLTTVWTVDELLRKHEFPRLDVLSVDVEGSELSVLAGANLTLWNPKVIVCESWEEESEARDYLKVLRYRHIDRRGDNDLYLRGE